jgi:ADP-heptose:LPS heptosyltransferase
MPILDRLKEARQRRRVPSQFDSRFREFVRRMERQIKFQLSGTFGFLLRPKRAKLPLPLSRVSSVLFLRYDALGDAVLTTPLFRAIKRAAPHIRIGVAASNRSRPIFDNDPDVDDVFLLSESPSFQLLRELRRARKTKWDVVINLVFRDKTRGAIYSKIVAPNGISVTGVREKKEKYRNIYSAIVDRPPFRPPTPMVRQILQMLKETLDFPADIMNERPSLPEFSKIAEPFRRELEAILRISGTSEYLIINTDASQGYKEWGVDNSLALAGRIVKAWPEYHVFLSSAPARAESIHTRLVRKETRISYLKTPSVLHLAVAIRHARAVVSPDTSVAHFAAAQGVPVVGLYLVPNEFLPYAIPHRMLYSTEEKPASAIPLEDVFKALENLLAETSQAKSAIEQ